MNWVCWQIEEPIFFHLRAHCAKGFKARCLMSSCIDNFMSDVIFLHNVVRVDYISIIDLVKLGYCVLKALRRSWKLKNPRGSFSEALPEVLAVDALATGQCCLQLPSLWQKVVIGVRFLWYQLIFGLAYPWRWWGWVSCIAETDGSGGLFYFGH